MIVHLSPIPFVGVYVAMLLLLCLLEVELCCPAMEGCADSICVALYIARIICIAGMCVVVQEFFAVCRWNMQCVAGSSILLVELFVVCCRNLYCASVIYVLVLEIFVVCGWILCCVAGSCTVIV